MAAGHQYLVLLAVLFIVGPVLGIEADLREQELKEQELEFAASSEFGNSVDPDEMISDDELDSLKVAVRGNNCKKVKCKNCTDIGGVYKRKGSCENRVAHFECSRWRKCDCCLKPRSCNFGSITYPNKAILTMSCMEFQCIDGCWEYTDKFDNNCGNCTFGGEPVIYPFDTLNNTKPFEYDGNGTFVMTQPYFATPGPGPQIGHANFGVMGHFTKNGLIDYCGAITSCVNGVTYYEGGITVRMSLVNTGEEEPAYHVVYVNGKNVTIGNGPCKVNVFHGTGGAILVFKHDRIDGGGQKCISVIGTQGLAVALCSTDPSQSLPYGNVSPYAFIYASPNLKATPSQMYGLCNTWTGSNVDCFTAQNGPCVDDWKCGTTEVYPLLSVPILCNGLAESWEVFPWP